MYQTTTELVPTANVAINKSRIKVYDKESSEPTYYLEDGTQFQIELFNPLMRNVMAKISIDGKLISQNGLILRPGERVFLERYLDVAKKFKFNTYLVGNTDEVRQAISNNGKIEIKFFEEYIEPPKKIELGNLLKDSNIPGGIPSFPPNPYYIGDMFFGSSNDTTITTDSLGDITSGNVNLNTTGGVGSGYDGTISTYNTSFENTLGSLSLDVNTPQGPNKRSFKKSLKKLKGSKKIETGQVEKGGFSSQEMVTVDKTFNTFPFHTVSYKLLPSSQKNITVDEIIKKFCSSCAAKLKKGDKFCSQCGVKL